jgi:uncharacterized LabA/DUF88 family protein
MEKILIICDNSNIFIGAQKTFGADARFMYDDFEKLCAGNGTVIEKHIVGSNSTSDSFWNGCKANGWKVHTYQRVRGHEKAVDTAIAMNSVMAIQKHKPDRVVLMTGDYDFAPLAEIREDMRKEQGHSFIWDLWSFSEALGYELAELCDHVYVLDEYENELIKYRKPDGFLESSLEHKERLVKEKRMAEEAEQRLRVAEDIAQKRREVEYSAACERQKEAAERSAHEDRIADIESSRKRGRPTFQVKSIVLVGLAATIIGGVVGAVFAQQGVFRE